MQILNGFLCVLGSALGVVMAVVCVLYAFHLDAAPRLGADLPLLLAFTCVFVLLALAGGVAFAAQRRQWRWRWALQALPLAPLAGLAGLLAALRG